MAEHKGLFTSSKLDSYLAAEPPMQVDQLSDRIWTISDGVYRSIFLAGDSGLVAFDTFGTPGKARAYRAAMDQALPGQPVKTIIYTHDHLDHAGFAADLAPDAEIVADELAAKVIRLRDADGQLPPTRTVSGQETSWEEDGLAFKLLNPGPTHGSGNLSAWFPGDGLLFSSDTILPNARYGLMPDYHIANFVKFMRQLSDLEWDTFVPGRYEVTDRARFLKGCNYIEAIQTAAQQAFVEMVPIWVMDAMQDYVGQALREEFSDLDGFDDQVGLTAIRIVHHYLMGGWGLEDTPDPGVLLAEEV